jgi:hypothetical protein
VTDRDRLILRATDSSIDTLLREARASVTHRSSVLCVLDGGTRTESAVWRETRSGWKRMFESTYLAPISSDVERGVLVAAFFDWLGQRYCHEIEPERNLACYEYLFAQAKRRHPGPVRSLLDLGCGPATILKTSLSSKVPRVVGYDIGSGVRKSARAAGLTVVTDRVFKHGNRTFDVVLSSFVMHYGCDLQVTLTAVASHLAPGGVWAMNFHKEINFPLFMASLPGTGLRLLEEPGLSPFGLVVMVDSDGRC